MQTLKDTSMDIVVAPPVPGPFAIKSVLAASGQALVYLIVWIFVLELAFYIACVGDSEHCTPDKKLGYKIFAGKRITQRKEGFGTFSLNSFGMQNDEVTLAKPKDTYRVAVFGDSYVEALQVDRSKNYCSLLAQKLTEDLGRPVEVLNFGVSNYSVAQDYLRYQTLARRFKPDLVVQAYRVDEIGKLLPQETTSLLFVRPVFFADDQGHISYDDTCVRSFFASSQGRYMVACDWLRHYSRLWEVLSGLKVQALSETTKLPGSFGTGGGAATTAAPAEPFVISSDKTRGDYTRCYWYMMDAQLAAFAAQCKADGSKFMFLRTPTIRVSEQKLLDNPDESRLLARTAGRLGVPVLDVDTSLRRVRGTTDDGTNFSGNGHFTAALHKYVAGELASYIKDQARLAR